jgi:hypothetical protein
MNAVIASEAIQNLSAEKVWIASAQIRGAQ